MSKHDLTADQLRAVFDFDPLTGVFSRRIEMGRNGRFKAGQPAGGVDSNGYVLLRLGAHRYSGHRLAWLYVHGKWPTLQIDHINGIRSDNRISNLREASHFINAQNETRPRANNTSGFLGVCWHKWSRRWVAQVWIDGKLRTVG